MTTKVNGMKRIKKDKRKERNGTRKEKRRKSLNLNKWEEKKKTEKKSWSWPGLRKSSGQNGVGGKATLSQSQNPEQMRLTLPLPAKDLPEGEVGGGRRGGRLGQA